MQKGITELNISRYEQISTARALENSYHKKTGSSCEIEGNVLVLESGGIYTCSPALVDWYYKSVYNSLASDVTVIINHDTRTASLVENRTDTKKRSSIMDNNTMRTAKAQTAIDLLKQTFLNVLHDAKVKGQPLLSPSEISKQLGISPVADNGLSKSILSMLLSDNLVECVLSSNISKYKLVD